MDRQKQARGGHNLELRLLIFMKRVVANKTLTGVMPLCHDSIANEIKPLLFLMHKTPSPPLYSLAWTRLYCCESTKKRGLGMPQICVWMFIKAASENPVEFIEFSGKKGALKLE